MENQQDYIEDSARVIEAADGKIKFEIIQSGSCQSCGLHGICGSNNKPIIHETSTKLDCQKGDLIKVHLSAGVKILSAFVLFMIPIFSMIAFYLLAKMLFTWSEDFSILFSVFGLLCSGVFIYLVDKIYSRKVHFEVIEILEKGEL
ncbi:MAG: SoxR reducing system RseC family protein [Candidatus Cloacimonadales bacterium]